MSPFSVIVGAGLAPAAAAGVLLYALRRSGLGRPGPTLAALAAYLVGHGTLVGFGWPGTDITHALLVVAVGAAAWGLAEQALQRLPRYLLLVARLGVCVGGAHLLLAPRLKHGGVSLLAVLVVAIAAWVVWSALERLLRDAPGPAAMVLLGLWTAACAAAVLFSGNATTAMLVGPIIATVGMAFLLTLRSKEPGSLVGLAPVIASLLTAQVTIANYYTDGLPTPTLALLALAPPLAVGARWALASRGSIWAMGGEVATSLAAVSVAVVLAASQYFAPASTHEGTQTAPTSQRSEQKGAPKPAYDKNYGY